MTTYHVTETKLVARILALGLRTLQTSNWVNGKGERLGGGLVYSFENKTDALRWAAKMDWGMFCETGSGKISILTLETEETETVWETDLNDTLSQLQSEGRWLKSYTPIPARCIKGVEKFTPDHAKELVRLL